MRETHGAIKLLPEASVASRQCQGGLTQGYWKFATVQICENQGKKIKEALGRDFKMQ